MGVFRGKNQRVSRQFGARSRLDEDVLPEPPFECGGGKAFDAGFEEQGVAGVEERRQRSLADQNLLGGSVFRASMVLVYLLAPG